MILLVSAAIGVSACAPGLAAKGSLAGAPRIEENTVLGAYLWQDAAGLHMRFVTPGPGKRHFHGSLCAVEGTLEGVSEVRLGVGDHLLHSESRCVRWSMRTGVLDGFDLQIRARAVEIDLRIDGFMLSTHDIRLGDGGAEPPSNPFRIDL